MFPTKAPGGGNPPARPSGLRWKLNLRGRKTDEEKIIEIENTIKKEEEISKVKNITLLKYGSYYSASIEASLNENLKLQDIYELECKIKNNLKESELDLRYITINFIPEIKHAFTK